MKIFDHFYVGNFRCLDFHSRWRHIGNTCDLIYVPVHVLVNHCIIPIQYRIKEVHFYIFSHIKYFWIYYENPILSQYVTSCIGFWNPLIEPILYL